MKKLTVPWNNRNLERVHNLLKLSSNFSGSFMQHGVYAGYKTANATSKTVTFHFHNRV